MSKKPEQIMVGEELHICPECGYEDGFHTSFMRQIEKHCKIILICPSCHASFDPDWVVSV